MLAFEKIIIELVTKNALEHGIIDFVVWFVCHSYFILSYHVMLTRGLVCNWFGLVFVVELGKPGMDWSAIWWLEVGVGGGSGVPFRSVSNYFVLMAMNWEEDSTDLNWELHFHAFSTRLWCKLVLNEGFFYSNYWMLNSYLSLNKNWNRQIA